MYFGREKLGTREMPVAPIRPMDYSDNDLIIIGEQVQRVRADYPEFTEQQARVWEVLSRWRGEAGLSAAAVSYLASAICEVIGETH